MRRLRRKRLSESSWPKPKYMWNRLYRSGARKSAESPAIAAEFRLWLLAVSRIGASGHSPFEPGEVRELLVKYNRSTGEIGNYSSRAIEKQIDKLVEAGLLAPGSNQRCLVLPMDRVDTEERSRVHCPEHRHRHAYDSRSEWVWLNQNTGVVVADAA